MYECFWSSSSTEVALIQRPPIESFVLVYCFSCGVVRLLSGQEMTPGSLLTCALKDPQSLTNHQRLPPFPFDSPPFYLTVINEHDIWDELQLASETYWLEECWSVWWKLSIFDVVRFHVSWCWIFLLKGAFKSAEGGALLCYQQVLPIKPSATLFVSPAAKLKGVDQSFSSETLL